MEKIGIVGAGGWGTALSIILSDKFEITLWEKFPAYATVLSDTRENIEFLPGFKIPEHVAITSDIQTVCNNSFLVIVVPSQYFRETIKNVKPFYKSQKVLIATKGIEPETGMKMSEILYNEIGQCKFAVISGPTIASEVAAGKPTAAVVASGDTEMAREIQCMFSSRILRLYTSDDVCGVEICGGYKNVIAIGSGIIDALELGDNAKASYLTRSIEEMKRFGKMLGAKEKTFLGLAGIGDLITTSFSPSSRNHRFGQAIATGNAQQFLAHTRMVIEGISASKAIIKMAETHNVDIPIASSIYRIVHKNAKPSDEIEKLMTRELKHE
ncbi:MAG TPA: NAD(P)H-dependent glycerol-3-phosphate dehydrogenase [bacterium]|nr:NAD(P)H-dependent glycerol-3-phosphate dehydrogenase [bacterium]HOL48973.1 NAD(P)H-dependent glycerol-3-phosphate dehydrogenase [bacterium]HPO51349.1 NAD(P)H-dependent glycerol-3-phosphate dehydrogenase [bacterium]HXK44977.1 NAD(P)H-dependent glycerol-3-phosphate dehydrogenase [bacterium]